MDLYKVMDDNVTLTAGAANHESTVWQLSRDDYVTSSKLVFVKLTNGATAPTAAAQAQVMGSRDGTNYYNYGGPLVGNTDNNGSESQIITVPGGVEYIKVVSGGNTGQEVTVRWEGVVNG